jgi:capsular exopolysaccharide synthesis family protein
MPPKTILFTSGISSEGKTITVANTAIVLAQLGHQVLVVDADLRRPACHKALRVQNGPGLTDVLAGLIDLEPAIKTTAVPNLSLLNCGSIPPNPTELIGSKKMDETLRTLKTRYDFVLVDSPPVVPVSDAVDLSTLVDGVVLVVRGQQTPKHLAKMAVAQLNNSHTTILGVVLNRIDIRSADYAEYYRYYVSDYYPSVKLA